MGGVGVFFKGFVMSFINSIVILLFLLQDRFFIQALHFPFSIPTGAKRFFFSNMQWNSIIWDKLSFTVGNEKSYWVKQNDFLIWKCIFLQIYSLTHEWKSFRAWKRKMFQNCILIWNSKPSKITWVYSCFFLLFLREENFIWGMEKLPITAAIASLRTTPLWKTII